MIQELLISGWLDIVCECFESEKKAIALFANLISLKGSCPHPNYYSPCIIALLLGMFSINLASCEEEEFTLSGFRNVILISLLQRFDPEFLLLGRDRYGKH